MKLVLTGGFLGSGKTTAIHQAVIYLNREGKRAGVITNDQGTQQVDTQYIRSHHFPVEEVAGSCFCCNLPGLEKNMLSLIGTYHPDVIFAESVGSCTDLIATVVNPLLTTYGNKLDITLSVFADVQVLLTWLQGGKNIFHEHINYIYKKQLEEAEILVVNKTDLLTEEQLMQAKQLIAQQYGHKLVLYQSSLKLKSVSDWIKTIFKLELNNKLRASLELDYNKYGAGEAEMAWLDEELGILTNDQQAVETGFLFINNIHASVVAAGCPIGHLKFLLNDGQRQQKISFTAIKQPLARSRYKQIETDRVVILVNARIQTDPVLLRKIFSDEINLMETTAGCKILESKVSSFKPGFPKPSRRVTAD